MIWGAAMLALRRLRLLRELARRGTIAAVAEALSYSPSAVSQQLSTLEKEAGGRLLGPSGRRVRLTAQAELLVAHAGVLLEEMERTEAALAQSLHEIAGTLRVAAFQTAVLALVPGEFDLILGEESPGFPLARSEETERHALFADELWLTLPASWGDLPLGGLALRPFALEPLDTTAREWAPAVCRQAGFEPDVRYNSTDLQGDLPVVAGGR